MVPEDPKTMAVLEVDDIMIYERSRIAMGSFLFSFYGLGEHNRQHSAFGRRAGRTGRNSSWKNPQEFEQWWKSTVY